MLLTKKGHKYGTGYRYKPSAEEWDDRERPIFGRNANGTPVCYSPLRGRTHKRCMDIHRMANGRCAIHGGKTPEGSNWHVSRGKDVMSKFAGAMPPMVKSQYLDLLTQKDYLSLREEIALTDYQQLELVLELGTLDKRSMHKLWQALRDLQSAIERAKTNGKIQHLLVVAEEAVSYADDLRERNRVFDDIREVQEHRRKLTDTETTRIMKGRVQVPIDRVFALVTSIALIVRSAILDIVPEEYHPALLGRIQREINMLLPIVYDVESSQRSAEPAALESGEETRPITRKKSRA